MLAKRVRGAPSLSVVMIARDEAANIERALAAVWDACEEVVLCDTGSVDRTVALARRLARERGSHAS